MKQKLLFLMAFVLFGVTVTMAQTTITNVPNSFSVTYGVLSLPLDPEVSPPDAGVTFTYTSSDEDYVFINEFGRVYFESATTLLPEPPTITIKAIKDGNTVATKVIPVSIAKKNMELLVNPGAVVDKPYDGLTTATLNFSKFNLNAGDLAIGDGGAENLKLNFEGVTAEFDTETIGSDKPVTLSKAFVLSGLRAFCYTLTNALPALTGNITMGVQPTNFGLTSTSYTENLSERKLILDADVKETKLVSAITGTSGIVTVSVADDNKITITFLKAGSTTIRLTANGTDNYSFSETTITVTVTPPTEANTITLNPTYTFTYGETGKTIIPADVKENAVISYVVSDPSIATISPAGVITILKEGTTSVEVTSAQTWSYKETSKTVELKINKKTVTISGVTVKSKIYDGSADTELIWTNAVLDGVVSDDGDKIAIDIPASSPVTFDNANVGNNKAITGVPSVALKAGAGGNKTGNYTLDATNLAALKGNITKANQPANLGLPTTLTAFTGASSAVSLSSYLSGVNGTVTYTSSTNAAYTYTDATKIIEFSTAGTYTFTLTAVDEDGNYNNTTGTIVFTVSESDVVVFSGVNYRTLEYGNAEPLGVIASYSGGTISTGITYSSSNDAIVNVDASGNIKITGAAGTAIITVSVTDVSGSYNAGSTQVRITAIPRKIKLGGISVTGKVYNGNTAATVTGWGTATITNKVIGDEVNLGTQPTFTFIDKNVGTDKEMAVSGGSLTGADHTKYVLSAIDLKGTITPKNQPTNLGLPGTTVSLAYGEAYAVSPIIEEASTVNVNYSSNNEAVVKVNATTGQITYVGVGTAVITVNTTAKPSPAICNYNNGSGTLTIQVTKGNQVITAPASINLILADGAYTLAPTALGNPTFTFEAIDNDDNVIEVNATTGVVTPKKIGTARVLITALTTVHYHEKKQTVTVHVIENVTITTQPVAQNVCLGSPFTLSVTATGAATYQWYKGSTAISGATANAYKVSAAVATDAGSYYVRVTGANGTPVNSNTVAITIGSEVNITAQPLARTVCQGSMVTFSVAATGSSLTYQWYKNGAAISGATNSTYQISDVQATDTALYKVRVAGSATCGTGEATSTDVRLSMVSPLPATLSFYQVPDYLVKRNVDHAIIVGDRTKGYEGVTKYTWNYSSDLDAFTTKETTSNTNTFRVTPNTVYGILSVTLTHICGNRTLEKDLKAVPMGIEDITAIGAKIYPNPVVSGSQMNVDLGNGNTKATIYIYSIAGALLKNANLTAQVSTIPMTLKPGVYMMKIVVPEGKTVHHRFIVK